jgi:hypothetical protein
MSISKATPGPWTLELCRLSPDSPLFGFGIKAVGKVPFVASAGVASPNHALIVDPDFRNICTTGYTEEEVEANAHLIAAAPDLYEALKAMLKYYDTPSGPADLLAQATAAIAKADGH